MLSPKRYMGSPCGYGHPGERYISSRNCVVCTQIRASRYLAGNKKKVRESQKRRYQAKADSLRANARKYHAEHREIRNANVREWSANNRDRRNATLRKWRETNPGRATALQMARSAAQLTRTPAWAKTSEHRAEIDSIYRKAKEVSKKTGIPHEVDHFYPLRGKTVSGLHVAGNLRVIEASKNRKKYNLIEEAAN